MRADAWKTYLLKVNRYIEALRRSADWPSRVRLQRLQDFIGDEIMGNEWQPTSELEDEQERG